MAEQRRHEGRFGLVFIAILCTIVLTSAVGNGDLGKIVVTIAVSGTLLLSLHASGVSRRVMSWAIVATVVGTVLASAGLTAGPHSFPRAAGGVIFCVLIAASPVAIVARLIQDHHITFQTVAGALCVYLLVGLFFTSLFSLIATIETDPFFVQGNATTVDFLYFSYVTLATVGYGDYTAAGNLGRMLAVTEALLGQLYLVSVVALVVGRIGQSREPGRLLRRKGPDPSEDLAPPDHPG
jgi:hypothetical protein